MDYCLLIPSQSRVLCREEQLLLTFFYEGSRQLKLNRASLAKQGAESAGPLFSTWCSSACRSTRKVRNLKSPAPISNPALFCACQVYSGTDCAIPIFEPPAEKELPFVNSLPNCEFRLPRIKHFSLLLDGSGSGNRE